MASVSSASPSGHSFRQEESESDWEHIDSNPSSSVRFFPSPASGSLSSWGFVQQFPNQVAGPSPPAVSPLNLDDQNTSFSAVPMPEHSDPTAVAAVTSAGSLDSQFMPTSFEPHSFYNPSTDFLFDDQFATNTPIDPTSYIPTFPNEFSGFDALSFDSPAQPQPQQQQPQQPALDLGIPQQLRIKDNAPPWNHVNLDNAGPAAALQEPIDFKQQQQPSHSPSHSSPMSSSYMPSPKSPDIKLEPGKAPSPIRRTKGGNKVEKRRAPTSNNTNFEVIIMTPNLINAQSGKSNPYECFEAMRATQRGRKGPLAVDTKESALQVRRRGACFCCHSRKVKCDSERPCKNCKKLTAQIPQVMCWQFQDFIPVLFPEFIRGHLRKEQVSSFIATNVQEFRIEGSDRPCTIEFTSGAQFQSTLTVPATFFTARTPEILQHWHLDANGNQPTLQSLAAVPIGIDPENAAHREEMKKRSREYIHNLTFEPFYAEQVTDAIRLTTLPRRILKIVQRFSQRTNLPMAKRALSIYVLHYVLTRQLCLTETAIFNLQHTNLVPLDSPVLTSRVLNRQVKAVLDELLLKEMQSLFDSFSKSLKPKSKKEWAPCLAAFLVLCLFMESVETAAGHFVRTENELSRGFCNGAQAPLPYRSDFAPSICREIDNMPFKQFAYQFHHIYQTHSKDATTKPYNPLADEGFDQQSELDPAASDMVSELKLLLMGDGWFELDFLVPDPVFPTADGGGGGEGVPPQYPDHTGRLLARFLLSFKDEKYLFDGQF